MFQLHYACVDRIAGLTVPKLEQLALFVIAFCLFFFSSFFFNHSVNTAFSSTESIADLHASCWRRVRLITSSSMTPIKATQYSFVQFAPLIDLVVGWDMRDNSAEILDQNRHSEKRKSGNRVLPATPETARDAMYSVCVSGACFLNPRFSSLQFGSVP